MLGGENMEKKFVEVTLNEKTIEKGGCPDGCQRGKGSPTGG